MPHTVSLQVCMCTYKICVKRFSDNQVGSNVLHKHFNKIYWTKGELRQSLKAQWALKTKENQGIAEWTFYCWFLNYFLWSYVSSVMGLAWLKIKSEVCKYSRVIYRHKHQLEEWHHQTHQQWERDINYSVHGCIHPWHWNIYALIHTYPVYIHNDTYIYGISSNRHLSCYFFHCKNWYNVYSRAVFISFST